MASWRPPNIIHEAGLKSATNSGPEPASGMNVIIICGIERPPSPTGIVTDVYLKGANTCAGDRLGVGALAGCSRAG